MLSICHPAPFRSRLTSKCREGMLVALPLLSTASELWPAPYELLPLLQLPRSCWLPYELSQQSKLPLRHSTSLSSDTTGTMIFCDCSMGSPPDQYDCPAQSGRAFTSNDLCRYRILICILRISIDLMPRLEMSMKHRLTNLTDLNYCVPVTYTVLVLFC